MINVSSFLTESLCGIFVKKVVEGSVADRQGKILPNDQVIEVSQDKLLERRTCCSAGLLVRLMVFYI